MRSTARFYPAFTFLQIPFWLWKWDKSVSLHSFGIPLIWIACPPCTSKHHFGDVAYKTTISQIHNTVCLWDKDGGLFTSPDLIKNAARWLVGYFSLIDVSEPSIWVQVNCNVTIWVQVNCSVTIWVPVKCNVTIWVPVNCNLIIWVLVNCSATIPYTNSRVPVHYNVKIHLQTMRYQ